MGTIRTFKGDTGENYMNLQDPAHRPCSFAFVATGDIDNDGKPEILSPRCGAVASQGYGIVAYNNDGTLRWDNYAKVSAWNATHSPPTAYNYLNVRSDGIITLADLDGDGMKQILMGPNIFNADGSVRCAKDQSVYSGQGDAANGAWSLYSVSVADIDLDGKQEIIGGNAAYDSNCNLKWWNSGLPDGATAIANFDDDPYPEIVLVTN